MAAPLEEMANFAHRDELMAHEHFFFLRSTACVKGARVLTPRRRPKSPR